MTRLASSSGKAIGDPITLEKATESSPANNLNGVAVGEGSAWVINSTNAILTRIDAASGEVTGQRIPAIYHPSGVAVGKGLVWVANGDADTVARIDPVSLKLVGSPIPVGDTPLAIAIGGGSAWVASSGDNHRYADRPCLRESHRGTNRCGRVARRYCRG